MGKVKPPRGRWSRPARGQANDFPAEGLRLVIKRRSKAISSCMGAGSPSARGRPLCAVLAQAIQHKDNHAQYTTIWKMPVHHQCRVSPSLTTTWILDSPALSGPIARNPCSFYDPEWAILQSPHYFSAFVRGPAKKRDFAGAGLASFIGCPRQGSSRPSLGSLDLDLSVTISYRIGCPGPGSCAPSI